MENMQKLINIYNNLMQIRVDGQNVILLSECLIAIQEMIIGMQKKANDDAHKVNEKE